MRRTILIFFLAICWAGGRAWAQDIGVKTNILYWATSTPNLGFEFGLGTVSYTHLTLPTT